MYSFQNVNYIYKNKLILYEMLQRMKVSRKLYLKTYYTNIIKGLAHDQIFFSKTYLTGKILSARIVIRFRYFFFSKEKHFLQGGLDLDFQNSISKPYNTILNITNLHKSNEITNRSPLRPI